jgi:predicted amino acid dehydrogenase
MDSSIVAKPEGQLQPHWREGKFAYDTASTDTELMVGALVHDGLRLNLHGTEMIHELVPVLKREILKLCIPKSSLIVYAPPGLVLPKGTPPTLVEKVTSDYSETELIGIPVAADQLLNTPEVPRLIQEAVALASSPIVTLAGMLPSLTGLGTQPTFANKSLSTGHGATVCAMYFNTVAMIEALSLNWQDLHVGVLGYGSIGRSSLELCLAKLGKPGKVSLCDPKLDNGVVNLDDCDLILGATSGGATLIVDALKPGVVVLDDSFPQAFKTEDAKIRMNEHEDVLLLGGGAFDLGSLERWSPFAQASNLRKLYGESWVPGCQAEAILLSVFPELGPTQGPVTLERALVILEAIETLGWCAPPPHLGPWVVPETLVKKVKDMPRGSDT